MITTREYLADMLDKLDDVEKYVVFTADLTIFKKCTNLEVIDVGMSESMILPMAYAMWKCGRIPIIYTICSYAITANYDFFTNTVMYSDMDLIIINAGAGFVYEGMGHGHYLLNDVEMFRSFKDFWFIKDKTTIDKSIKSYNNGKCYIRLGYDNTDGMYDDYSTGYVHTITTPTLYPKIKHMYEAGVLYICENLNMTPPTRYVDLSIEDTKGYSIGLHSGINDQYRITQVTCPEEIPV